MAGIAPVKYDSSAFCVEAWLNQSESTFTTDGINRNPKVKFDRFRYKNVSLQLGNWQETQTGPSQDRGGTDFNCEIE